MYTNKIQASIDKTQEKLEALGFKSFDISFAVKKHLRKGVAGLAWGGRQHIEISIDYIREHEQRILSRTVPHEVVHLYVSKYYPYAKQSHGKEWKRLMEAIGCEQSAKHDMILGQKITFTGLVRPELIKPKILNCIGIANIIWNVKIQKYEGFNAGNVVSTNESYNVIKKVMGRIYGYEMFNVITP